MKSPVHLVLLLSGVAGLATAAGCAAPEPVVERSPRQRAEAQAELGLVRLRRGDLAGARRAYNTASALDPFFVRAHLGLARCHYVKGDLELEAAEYRKALALSPKLVRVWANLGHSLLAQDRLEEAGEAYLMVVALGRRDLVALQLALVERDLGRPLRLSTPLTTIAGLALAEPAAAEGPEQAEAFPELEPPADVR